MQDQEVSFWEHLGELRARILRCLIALAICTGIGWAMVDSVLAWLTRPVGTLVFLTPTGAFMARLKIAVMIGMGLALPIFFYQAWRFVSLGLDEREKRLVGRLGLPCGILLICGAAFCLRLVVPRCMPYLLGYGSPSLRPMISIESYLSFIIFLTVAFALVFQLPVVVVGLAWTGVLSPHALRQHWRIIYVVIFIVAAVMTPGPDVFSQLMLAVPSIFLYELSILAARWVYPKSG